MPPLFQFLIEVIQEDITQERRKRPALRNALRCLVQPAVYDDSGPKVFADQLEDALSLTRLPTRLINTSQLTLSKNFARSMSTE